LKIDYYECNVVGLRVFQSSGWPAEHFVEKTRSELLAHLANEKTQARGLGFLFRGTVFLFAAVASCLHIVM
jgi:hypothetical protein